MGPLFVSKESFEPFAIGSLSIVAFSLLLAALASKRSQKPHALVFQGERLAQEGRKLAIYDPVSGVLARWYFELRLEEETRRSRRYDQPMAVLTIQSVSDGPRLSGAAAQQVATASLSRVALVCARNTDLIGMLDFNSLAICLTQTDRVGAFSLLRRMMSELEGTQCNVGVAFSPQDEGDGMELIDLAVTRSAPWQKLPSSVGSKVA